MLLPPMLPDSIWVVDETDTEEHSVVAMIAWKTKPDIPKLNGAIGKFFYNQTDVQRLYMGVIVNGIDSNIQYSFRQRALTPFETLDLNARGLIND